MVLVALVVGRVAGQVPVVGRMAGQVAGPVALVVGRMALALVALVVGRVAVALVVGR